MENFANFMTAVLVVVILLGGPLTLYAAIYLLNQQFAAVKARFVRLKKTDNEAPSLGLSISWDPETLEHEIFRARVEYFELVKGGRATTFSFTFEGKAAKKRSFVIPMKLPQQTLEMLTDTSSPGIFKRSFVQIEIEMTTGQTVRFKIPKKDIRAAYQGLPLIPDAQTEVVAAREPDSWSLMTRVFPWRKVVAEAAAAPEKKGAGGPKEAKASGPSLVDFIVTKVWIEPGCIVCDACENEAPQVFQVLPDTCIVRENAPLDDGGAIAAAAEGCPVNVIKFDSKPK